ncbi:MAG TPA: hypothetical protein VEJ88_03505, partial [Dissulfurispiraceae bacterium]|nr:hypothetical protein [Dissulfurispiraceae bacterium]
GWAFISGETASESETYVILQSELRSYTVTSRKIRWPDISTRFQMDGLNDLGFQVFVPYDQIESGRYRIGIQVINGDMQAVVYTDRIVNV